jgi:two-component system sensor histidine kinase UhpB
VPTAWESYRSWIVGTAIVTAAQLLLIAGLLAQRARRRRAERIARKREARLRESYERIRQLAGRLIDAQEVARAALARDLHDDVCQELAALSMAVSALKRSSGDIQMLPAQRSLSILQNKARQIVENIRRLSHELHPSNLQLLGLAAALEEHCIQCERQHAVRVGFRSAGEIGPMDSAVALCLFRIAQEALRNGIAHGEARQLDVSLKRLGEDVELIVIDDGRGFDSTQFRNDGGLGLVSIEERACYVGGYVTIESQPGKGTLVRVRVPARTDGGWQGHAVQVPAVATPTQTNAGGLL